MRCSKNRCGDLGKAKGFQMYFRALHCPLRWMVIRFIGRGDKGSGEILEGLKDAGEELARMSLYYHLSELEEAGILELAGYREVGGGAPEKVWRLKTQRDQDRSPPGFKENLASNVQEGESDWRMR